MESIRKQKLTEYAATINRDCFWEYDFSDSDIIQMARQGDDRQKIFLFNKIIENAPDVLKSLAIFRPEDQRKLLIQYRVPAFKKDFLERCHKILKYLVAHQEVDIPELQWEQQITATFTPALPDS